MPDGKTLYLVRHAQAGWPQNGQCNFERTLDPTGKLEAVKMGRRLKARRVVPDRVIASPARRILETLELMAIVPPVTACIFEEQLYEASLADLLKVLRRLEDDCSVAMLVGHNPGMTWLVKHLTGKDIGTMPTASVATLHLDSDHWGDLNSIPMELLDFNFPGRLAEDSLDGN